MKILLNYISFFLLGVIQLSGQSGVETNLVGRWAAGPPNAFTIENNIIFTASGGILQTLDISDPSNPKLLGQVATSGIINDISKEGNYVYLAEGDSGLKVIDVSNPANLIQVSEILLTGPINKLIVNNQTLYVAEGGYDGSQWTGGLRTLDVSDPFNPQPLGFYDSPNQSKFISLVGDYIYMDKRFDETLIIDVSDLNNPILAGSFNTRLDNTFLSGNLLFIGMNIFDVSNPVNPILLVETVFQGGAEDVTVSGDYAFITVWKIWDGNTWREGQIRVFNISDPVNPTEIGFYEASGNVSMISIMNNVLIISEGVYPEDVSTSEEGSGLRFIDVSYPQLPKLIGFYELPGVATQLTVQDDYAFVVTLYGGISIIDITDISNPIQIGYYNSPGMGREIVLKENFVYLTDGNKGLRIVDISDLTNPVEVGSYETGDFFSKIDVSGNFAYVLYGDGLHVLDISNPLYIFEVSFVEISFTPLSILVRENYAYLGDGISTHWGGTGHIRIFNIADPFNPVQVGEYYPGYIQWEDIFYPTDLEIRGNYLYVANETSSLLILDILDPTNPFVASNTSTFADNIEIYENFAFVSKSLVGMNIFDISNPNNPVLLEFYNEYRHITDLAVTDGKIFAAAVEYGMLIFENELITDVARDTEIIPTEFTLQQNYPNPFNPSTKISYSIPSSEYVTLKIYDILGSEIALLVNKEQTAGFYNVEFNATNFPSGIYIYTLQFGNRMTSKKMILLK